MVGRQVELQQIEAKLALAAEGHSQIIGIVAEAGLGKSRLVAEVIRAARQQGLPAMAARVKRMQSARHIRRGKLFGGRSLALTMSCP
jgi:predicted ATPase